VVKIFIEENKMKNYKEAFKELELYICDLWTAQNTQYERSPEKIFVDLQAKIREIREELNV